MTTMTTNLTENQTAIRERFMRAIGEAYAMLGIAEPRYVEYYPMLRAAGIDPMIAELGSRWFDTELTVYGQLRPTFRVSTDVCLTVTLGRHDFTVTVETRWASGGGTVSSALAQAKHHMAAIERAAMAEEMIRDASTAMRGDDERAAIMKSASDVAQAAYQQANALVVEARRAAKDSK